MNVTTSFQRKNRSKALFDGVTRVCLGKCVTHFVTLFEEFFIFNF